MRDPEVEEANSTPVPDERRGWLARGVYLALAGISLLLGVVGIVLPGLPTTPFILLTSYFLAKGSPRLRRRLLESRLFGSLLKDWQKHRGVHRAIKVRAVALIVIVVGATCWFSGLSTTLLVVIVFAACIGVGVVIALPEIDSSAD